MKLINKLNSVPRFRMRGIITFSICHYGVKRSNLAFTYLEKKCVCLVENTQGVFQGVDITVGDYFLGLFDQKIYNLHEFLSQCLWRSGLS